jgi:hypothetical protein
MAKINLRTSLHNKTENRYFNNEVSAILDDKENIKYLDNNVTVSIQKLDNGINIIRRCDDYEIHLLLEEGKKTKGLYNVKGLGCLDMEVETTSLIIGDNTLEVHYKMIVDSESASEFKFYLEYM